MGSGDGCGKECGKDKAELRGPGVILEMMVGSGGRERDNGTAHLLWSEVEADDTHGGVWGRKGAGE